MGSASESFAEYLAALDEPSLAGLLARRCDVLYDPPPRGFVQLVQRLSGAESLSRAMALLDRDTAIVSQVIAVLGGGAAPATIVDVTDVSEVAVLRCVDDLCRRGMAWTTDDGVAWLVTPLAEHWVQQFEHFRPLRTLVQAAVVEDLRATATALGVPVGGLRKPELVAKITEATADPRALIERIVRLAEPDRDRLLEYYGGDDDYAHASHARADPMRAALAAGLAVRVYGRAEVPREVAMAARLADRDLSLDGRPELPPSEADQAVVRASAQAAAQEAVRTVTVLLDEAAATPIAELKKGGIGPRERSRLARRLSLPEAELPLWLDIAFVAGLLNSIDAGYVPTPDYAVWREAEPAVRWTSLAAAWFALDFAPTSREVGDGVQAPPPVPLVSSAGRVRRAVLTAARGGGSVAAAGGKAWWYVPLSGYPTDQLATKVAAAVREAELLGVVVADTLTDFGENLTASLDDDVPSTESDVDVLLELVRGCEPLLPVTGSSVVLQSDLTAVVSGQPSAATARLLADAAVVEARGGAQTWRFTPASVRSALDAGWQADDLLGQLRAVSEHALPQALEYLIGDVARRHGEARVREVRCCVVADEALTKEILHTRTLAGLQLRQLAPTVLASPVERAVVLAKLRDAGMYPVAENADGTVAVERRAEYRAPRQRRPTHDSTRVRAKFAPTELARRLAADPTGAAAPAPATSKTLVLLGELNRYLDEAELELLADALDQQRDVTITYRDRNGSHTVRRIRPERLFGKWIDAWCYLRDDQREFTVANIESVDPGY